MQLNTQPIEKADLDPYGTLDVHGAFYTIQGEGPFTGHPAVFIRLAGCNLQCPACDTDYTSTRKRRTPASVAAEVHALSEPRRDPHAPACLVVITGGEPFRQNLTPLCAMLLTRGYRVQVETNGTLPPPEGLSHDVAVVVSPKAGKVHPATAARAMAWKYVLDADSIDLDGLPIRALGHSASPHVARPPGDFPRHMIYIQPADRQSMQTNERNGRAVIQTCMRNGYTLQLQTHKLLGLE